jgi:hypothetical protein
VASERSRKGREVAGVYQLGTHHRQPQLGADIPSQGKGYTVALRIQRYGEKASLLDVLDSIAMDYGADLYLPSGEISDTLLYTMAKHGDADARELVVITVADCDPGGHQMPVSIGRKLQALRDLCFPSLEFRVVPAALTVEQVKRLRLPSTPLKETEKRADKWRDAFGVEQTEIDALATLRPQELQRIVIDAIEPYYDDTLDRRVREARDACVAASQQALDDHINPDLIAEAEAHAEQLQADIEAIDEQCGEVDLPKMVVPEAMVDDVARQALISTEMDWVEAT